MTRKERQRLATTAIAAALGLAFPGLGLLYLRHERYAAAVAGSIVLMFVLSAWTHFIYTAGGFYLTLLAPLLLHVASFAYTVLLAWRARRAPQGRRWDLALYLLVAGLIGYVVIVSHRAPLLGYEVFRVSSSAMGDTLIPGDHFVSNLRKYRTLEPARYEVVFYQFPGDAQIQYVGRIIGLPGEVIDIKNGRVHANGARLSEPYVKPEYNRTTSVQRFRVIVPKDNYFVMGDYRDRANDSRYWGMLPRANVYGTVEFVAWSARPSWQIPGDIDWDKGRNSSIRWERLGKTVE